METGEINITILNMKKASEDLPDIPDKVNLEVECSKSIFDGFYRAILIKTKKLLDKDTEPSKYKEDISQSYKIKFKMDEEGVVDTKFIPNLRKDDIPALMSLLMMVKSKK